MARLYTYRMSTDTAIVMALTSYYDYNVVLFFFFLQMTEKLIQYQDQSRDIDQLFQSKPFTFRKICLCTGRAERL